MLQQTGARHPGVARPPLATLVVLSAVGPLAINMFMPSMPSIAVDFGVPYATVQLGLSLYLFMMALLQLVSGPVSDRIGRRPVLITCMSIFIVGSLVCTFAPNVEIFLTGRVIQTSGAAGMVLSRTIVRDVYPREKSASMIGYVVMGMAIAPMIAPAIGGLADELAGWRASFALLTFFGVIALFCTLWFLPETNTNQGQSARTQFATWGMLAKMPVFWLYASTSSVTSALFFGFLGGGPAISSVFLGQSPFEYGLWFALCAIGYSLGNFLSGRFSQRRGIEPMVRDGALVSVIGCGVSLFLFVAGIDHPASLFAPMVLIGIGNGLVLPNATAAVISLKPEASGAASGLLGALQIACGALASIGAAFAAAGGESPIGLTFYLAVISVAAFALALAAIRAPVAAN